MKVAAIIGSPQGMKGRTGMLVKEILDAAQQAGAETEVYSLGDLVVQPCKGCQEICHKTGTCHQKDDFENIKSAMLAAEGIIFATPNYTMHVSAQLKALIDRCNLMLHCQRFKGKYGAAVVTSGGSDPEVVVNYLNSVMTNYGIWKLGSISAVRAQINDLDEKARLIAEARDLGRRMVTAIKSKQRFPEQEENLNQSFEIMKFMVMMLKEEWPYAWNYWNTHWELNEGNQDS